MSWKRAAAGANFKRGDGGPEEFETKAEPQPVVLVSVVLDGEDRATCEEHLDELELLAQTAGYEVCGRLIQDRGRPEAATLLGRGKVLEAGKDEANSVFTGSGKKVRDLIGLAYKHVCQADEAERESFLGSESVKA